MIQLNNITVTFNATTPLKNTLFSGLHLTISPKDFVTIIGGNGSGKSSLLNLIAGELTPTSGTILLDNQDITQQKPHERAAVISRVFQDPLLGSYSELTLEENLSIAFSRDKKRTLRLALSRTQQTFFQEKLSSLGLGLENRLFDKMGLLSGGQRQAVSLIMATLKPTSILLLDEHTAALDPKTAESILRLTQKLVADNQLTALMVTHQMSQALSVGNRTLLMHQGNIIQDLKEHERKNLNAQDLAKLF